MSDKKLVFYTNPMSRARVVHWMLEEIGCEYETKILEYGTSMKAPDYLAINPMGKVPAITHGDAVVTEVSAIGLYLAENFPDAKLTPAENDLKARADYYRWILFVAGPLEAAITSKLFHFEVPKDKEASLGYGNYEQVLKVIESAIKDKKYIAGNHFTMADLLLSAYLSYYMSFNAIPENAVFKAYADQHKNRAAALRAEKINNDLMEQRKAS